MEFKLYIQVRVTVGPAGIFQRNQVLSKEASESGSRVGGRGMKRAHGRRRIFKIIQKIN